MSCGPSKPAAIAGLSPCERLAIVEDALHKLGSGQHKIRVRHGEYEVEYSRGNVAFLERERARLSQLCSGSNRRAITIGRTRGC